MPSTAAFLGPADFDGGFVPQPGPVTDGLQSTYEGTIVATMLDRPLVEHVLPAGLHLAMPRTPATQHPVLYLIGTQADPSSVSQGVATKIPTAAAYRELILLVPFVVHDSGTRHHNFVVRMYLDDLSAVVGGNSVFGYAKEWAVLSSSGAPEHLVHEVSSLLGKPYFSAEIEHAAFPLPGTAVQAPPARWSDIAKIFEMPILGQGASGFICSYWEWDEGNAQLLPATSKHRFVSAFVTGMEDWTTLGMLANAPDGAVAVRGLRWRLAWKLPPWQPAPCSF